MDQSSMISDVTLKTDLWVAYVMLSPLYDQCDGGHELTVKHILIECNFHSSIRRRHYNVTDLNQLFKTVSSQKILDFV